MRRGEILSERWEDIDFSRRVLSVTHSKTAEGESREIPLTERLYNLLWQHRKATGLVFTFNDQPIRRIKTAWKAAVRRAGIKFYRFKDLRATFNSRLIEAGVIKDVRKELMGHSRNEDTNDLYSHIELPLLRAAIRKLEEWQKQEFQKLEKEGDGSNPQTTTDGSTYTGSAA
jgi:integrase